jgi:hypothetical protein
MKPARRLNGRLLMRRKKWMWPLSGPDSLVCLPRFTWRNLVQMLPLWMRSTLGGGRRDAMAGFVA